MNSTPPSQEAIRQPESAAGLRAASGSVDAPRWDDNGDPINLSAAAADALDWMEWLRDYMTRDKATKWDQARANLSRCAVALRKKIDETISSPEESRTSLSETEGGSASEGADDPSAMTVPPNGALTRAGENPKP